MRNVDILHTYTAYVYMLIAFIPITMCVLSRNFLKRKTSLLYDDC